MRVVSANRIDAHRRRQRKRQTEAADSAHVTAPGVMNFSDAWWLQSVAAGLNLRAAEVWWILVLTWERDYTEAHAVTDA